MYHCYKAVVPKLNIIAMLGSGTSRATARAIVLLVTSPLLICVMSADSEDAPHSKESRGLFSPRVDYDEWTPLGRGDPLKNDPTYDYVPPVLERVHYWIDPASRTPDPSPPSVASQPEVVDTETPVTAADSRRDSYDPFLKFVDGPKFNSPSQQTIYYPHHHHHHHRPSSSSQRKPYVPSYYSSYYQQSPSKNTHIIPSVETQNYLQQQQQLQKQHDMETISLPPDAQHQQQQHQQQQRPPYTMLVPPAPQMTDTFSMPEYQDPMTAEQSTTPQSTPYTTTLPSSVTFDEANLIFHSSTSSYWDDGKTQLATLAQPSSQVTWKIPTSPPVIVKSSTYTSSPSTSSQTLPAKNTLTSTGYSNTKIYSSPNHFEKDRTKGGGHVSLLHTLLQDELKQPSFSPTMATTTTANPKRTTTTTTGVSLTTDPLFSHYKQPAEPLRGPMYLIIQGHSKVKTYGANKHQNSFHGIPIQESNELQANDRIGREIDYPGNEETKRKWLLTEEEEISGGKEKDGIAFTLAREEHIPTTPTINSLESVQGVIPTSKQENNEYRRKRQLSIEDLIPIDENTAEELIQDFLQQQGQGSGYGALLASTLLDGRRLVSKK